MQLALNNSAVVAWPAVGSPVLRFGTVTHARMRDSADGILENLLGFPDPLGPLVGHHLGL